MPFCHINRMLRAGLLTTYKVKIIYTSTRKLKDHFRSAKDKRDILSAQGVYQTPCQCNKIYVGQIKRPINTRMKEYKTDCRLGKRKISHRSPYVKRRKSWHAISGFAKESHHHTRLYLEDIEIQITKTVIKQETRKINGTVLNNPKALNRGRDALPTSTGSD